MFSKQYTSFEVKEMLTEINLIICRERFIGTAEYTVTTYYNQIYIIQITSIAWQHETLETLFPLFSTGKKTT